MRTQNTVNNTSVLEFWSGDQLKKIRRDILDGKQVPLCQSCYAEEEKTNDSLRKQSLGVYQLQNPGNYENIIADKSFPGRLEIHLGNLCNLKCLTCFPSDSSLFAVEERELKIMSNAAPPALIEINTDKIDELIKQSQEHNIHMLDLRGGEVLIMPKARQILESYPEHLAKNITLRVQTNGYKIDPHWEKIWSKFKRIEMALSIDGPGLANNYLRYPSRWEDIERNVKYLKSLPNISLLITCTVSNLNLLLLPELQRWGDEQQVRMFYYALNSPEYYQYTNMPAELYQEARSRAAGIEVFDRFFRSPADTQLWDKFCQVISARDAHRKNSIFDINPEFKTYWTKT